MQTAGKGSNSMGCHSGVAHLCRMLAQSKTTLVLTVTFSPMMSVMAFWRFISSHKSFATLLNKCCIPTAGSHSQGRLSVRCCQGPCADSSVSRSMDVYVHLHLTVSPSEMSFICHFGCHTLSLVCLHSSHCGSS